MRRPLFRALSLVTTGLLAATLAAPAQAAPPVTTPDTLTMHANTVQLLPDLLANDSDPDNADDLALCRWAPSTTDEVEMINFFGLDLVVTLPEAKGDYAYTYYACDYESLTPGTFTVKVLPSPKALITATKVKGKPGKIKFTNRSTFGFDLAWGAKGSPEPDGATRVKAKSSKVVNVKRARVFWEAYNSNNGSYKSGTVTKIKLPKGKKRKKRAGATAGVKQRFVLDGMVWLSPLRD